MSAASNPCPMDVFSLWMIPWIIVGGGAYVTCKACQKTYRGAKHVTEQTCHGCKNIIQFSKDKLQTAWAQQKSSYALEDLAPQIATFFEQGATITMPSHRYILSSEMMHVERPADFRVLVEIFSETIIGKHLDEFKELTSDKVSNLSIDFRHIFEIINSRLWLEEQYPEGIPDQIPAEIQEQYELKFITEQDRVRYEDRARTLASSN